MSFQATGEAPFNLPAGSLKLAGYNVTPIARTTVGALQAVVLSDAQTSYDQLLVLVTGDLEAASQNITTLNLHNGTAEIGTAVTLITGPTATTARVSWAYAYVLVAGTHYTKATGFTLSGYVHATNAGLSGAGIKSNNMIVVGCV